MKKRILSLLCSLALLVTMMPATALAGGGDWEAFSDYEGFKALAEQTNTVPLELNNGSFTWPSDAQTLQINRPIRMGNSASWMIPANITVEFGPSGTILPVVSGDTGGTLYVEGTVICPTTTADNHAFPLLEECESGVEVVLKSGAKIKGNVYIPDRATWRVENGAQLSVENGSVMLGGTLEGNGGQVGPLEVNNTYSSWGGEAPRTAILSGDLTVESLEVSYTETQDLASDLIIPSGSNIHVTDQLSMVEWPNRVSRLSLDGTLTVESGFHRVGGEIMLGNSGVLQLNQGSKLEAYNMEYPGQITGTGTIKAYAGEDGYSGMPMLWNSTRINEIVANREAYADLVETTVTIWCSWDSGCEHEWEKTGETPATCTETGAINYTCSKCNEPKTEIIPALGHQLTYSKSGDTITQSCKRPGCTHSADARLFVNNMTYTGLQITASISYDKNWWGALPSLRYEGENVNAGSGTVYATADDTEIHLPYTIYPATEYTVSLGNLSQYSDSVSAVTWTTDPPDKTATATVEYQVTTPEKPCTHVHDESCGANGENCQHQHDTSCGYAAAKAEWTTTQPTAVGSYPVRVKLTDSQNLVLKTGEDAYTTGTLIISTRSSGGGSGSSGSSGNKTETTTNPDGSTTTTVTRPGGSTTETTKYPDGSTEVIETKKDGTVTTTTTDKDGNKTVVTENTDGTTETIITNTTGTSSTTKTDADGKTETVVKLSASVVADAADKGEAVALSMPKVAATSDSASAPTVTVDLSGSQSAKVEIPVSGVTPGTVAVIVGEDGDEQIIMTSIPTENGVAVMLADGDTVKVMDNSKDFADVPTAYWGADAVDFVTSRALFNGTSETAFTPDGNMTRAMIVTVLARYEGVDTSTGENWYDAGRDWAMEAGISDGTDMDGTLTREQLATMLYRYVQSKGQGFTGAWAFQLDYPDADAVSDYAYEAMCWTTMHGIIDGMGDGSLVPQGQATRAQVATMLMRFIEHIA